MDPSTKTFKQSPPKAAPEPIYNSRVDVGLSIIQLKGMIEAMGLSASTPGARGNARHAVLLRRMSDVYDDEDASNSDLSDEDYNPPNDAIAPPPSTEEPFIKVRQRQRGDQKVAVRKFTNPPPLPFFTAPLLPKQGQGFWF